MITDPTMTPQQERPAAFSLDRLNDAQKAWDEFSGNRDEAERITSELTQLRPRGYLAVHGDGSCRVMRGDECLTPFRAIPESEAIQLAITERIQTNVRFSLSNRTWFDSEQPTT